MPNLNPDPPHIEPISERRDSSHRMNDLSSPARPYSASVMLRKRSIGHSARNASQICCCSGPAFIGSPLGLRFGKRCVFRDFPISAKAVGPAHLLGRSAVRLEERWTGDDDDGAARAARRDVETVRVVEKG